MSSRIMLAVATCVLIVGFVVVNADAAFTTVETPVNRVAVPEVNAETVQASPHEANFARAGANSSVGVEVDSVVLDQARFMNESGDVTVERFNDTQRFEIQTPFPSAIRFSGRFVNPTPFESNAVEARLRGSNLFGGETLKGFNVFVA